MKTHNPWFTHNLPSSVEGSRSSSTMRRVKHVARQHATTQHVARQHATTQHVQRHRLLPYFVVGIYSSRKRNAPAASTNTSTQAYRRDVKVINAQYVALKQCILSLPRRRFRNYRTLKIRSELRVLRSSEWERRLHTSSVLEMHHIGMVDERRWSVWMLSMEVGEE
jgi:hypothetical protein